MWVNEVWVYGNVSQSLHLHKVWLGESHPSIGFAEVIQSLDPRFAAARLWPRDLQGSVEGGEEGVGTGQRGNEGYERLLRVTKSQYKEKYRRGRGRRISIR